MPDLNNIIDYGIGPFPDVPEEVFAEIGCRLVLLQNFELMLSLVAKVAFETDPFKAKDAILRSDIKTMGQLIELLRKKVEIHEDFDATLKRTLAARNFFVHEFSNRYNLFSKEGLSEAIKFLVQSMDDLEGVTNTMKAVVITYGRERGVTDKNHETLWRKHGDLDRLEKHFVPKVNATLKQK